MSVAITVLRNNQPTGPFTREQVAQKLATQEASLDDLAFVEGLNAWTPLRDVLAQVDGNPPAVVVTAPAHSYAVTMQPPSHLQYGTFWERFFAYLIDSLILSALFAIVAVPFFILVGILAPLLQSTSNNGDDTASTVIGMLTIFIFMPVLLAASWLYFALLESSAAQGTYGKRMLGLKVADMEGKRVSFARASGRFLSKIISGFLPFAIGYIMEAFTERKQALHDMIASTIVVK